MKTTTKHKVMLISDGSLQSRLLKQSLEFHSPFDVTLTTPRKISDVHHDEIGKMKIVIFDLKQDYQTYFDEYKHKLERVNSSPFEVLINASEPMGKRALIQWNNLSGIFYEEEDCQTLIDGLKAITNGDMWLSRKTACELLQFYRSRQPKNTHSSYTALTKRERQIVKLLADGATNSRIANELYVSENTVKVHLHNTFKKINVDNRLQALIWVRDNIGSVEFID